MTSSRATQDSIAIASVDANRSPTTPKASTSATIRSTVSVWLGRRAASRRTATTRSSVTMTRTVTAATPAAVGRLTVLANRNAAAPAAGTPKNGTRRSAPAASAGSIGSGSRASRKITASTSAESTLTATSPRTCEPTAASTARQTSRARGRCGAGTSDSQIRSNVSRLALQYALSATTTTICAATSMVLRVRPSA